MGMTYGCAKCHDHKFDPILHKDYYRLQAFFANMRAQDDLDPADRATSWKPIKQQQAEWEEKTKAIRDEMHALVAPIAKGDARLLYASGSPTGTQEALEHAGRKAHALSIAAGLQGYAADHVSRTTTWRKKLKREQKKRFDELAARAEEVRFAEAASAGGADHDR